MQWERVDWSVHKTTPYEAWHCRGVWGMKARPYAATWYVRGIGYGGCDGDTPWQALKASYSLLKKEAANAVGT